MLIAGDIGGTTTRLALGTPRAGPRQFVAEQDAAAITRGCSRSSRRFRPRPAAAPAPAMNPNASRSAIKE